MKTPKYLTPYTPTVPYGTCNGCLHDAEDYMLKDDIWQQVARPSDKYLCFSCVEKRLGREIVDTDFSTLPINYICGHLPIEELTQEERKGWFFFWAGPPDHLVSLFHEMEKDPPMEGVGKEFYDWLTEQASVFEAVS